MFFSGAESEPIRPSADALRAVSGTLDDAALSSLAKACRAANDEPTAALAERLRDSGRRVVASTLTETKLPDG